MRIINKMDCGFLCPLVEPLCASGSQTQRFFAQHFAASICPGVSGNTFSLICFTRLLCFLNFQCWLVLSSYHLSISLHLVYILIQNLYQAIISPQQSLPHSTMAPATRSCGNPCFGRTDITHGNELRSTYCISPFTVEDAEGRPFRTWRVIYTPLAVLLLVLTAMSVAVVIYGAKSLKM